MQEVEEQIGCVNQTSNFFVGGWQDDWTKGSGQREGDSHPERREGSPVSRRGSEHFAEAGEEKLGAGAKNLTRNETKSHRLHHRRVEEEQSAEAHVPKPSGREKVP